MRKTHLKLRLASEEGALQRTIGTVERRGFRILVCNAILKDDSYHVELDVEGTRDPALLCRQLDRLFDVHETSLAVNG